MSPDLLAFLFLITSTAIVLGVAVTLRGIWGLVGDVSPRLPEPSLGDASGSVAGSSNPLELAGDGSPAGAVSGAPTATDSPVRDMRESLVMTIGGVFIVSGALIALATLIHNAP